MKFVDNPALQKELEKLAKLTSEAAADILILKEGVTNGETDNPEAVQKYNDNVFEVRANLFNIRMELQKVHQKISKHMSMCMNPEYYEKLKRKSSARKKKGDVVPVNNGQLKNMHTTKKKT